MAITQIRVDEIASFCDERCLTQRIVPVERMTVSYPERLSWTHSLRQRDKWQLRSLQARISLERKESHDEEIPPQSFCGI